MFLVAAIALLLTVGVQERLMHRRAENKIRSYRYGLFAKMYADQERDWKECEARAAKLEAEPVEDDAPRP